MLKRIISQTIKELAQFRRDRLTMALALALPTLTLLIFGFAIRLEAKDIPITIQDFDHSPQSQAYIEQIATTNMFRLVPGTPGKAIEFPIDQAQAQATVIIPPDFSDRLAQNQTANIQVLVDGTDANNARVIKNTFKAMTNAFMQRLGLVPSQSLVQTRTRLWFNPGRQESLFIVPGTYAVVLWIFPSLLAAIAMVREKEKGTILQAYASSLSAGELILGKAFAYLIISLAMTALVMGLGTIVFKMKFAGDPMPLLVGTPIYLLAAVMFGLFLGVRFNEQNSAVQGVALIGFLTALLLSGFIYPLSNIPFPLSLISNVVPARYFIEITRDAFVRGVGWSNIGLGLVMITIVGSGFFAIAYKLLSRMQLPD
jgi:ABC-2 type transport system permease protein